jgi:hypothetical protein
MVDLATLLPVRRLDNVGLPTSDREFRSFRDPPGRVPGTFRDVSAETSRNVPL